MSVVARSQLGEDVLVLGIANRQRALARSADDEVEAIESRRERDDEIEPSGFSFDATSDLNSPKSNHVVAPCLYRRAEILDELSERIADEIEDAAAGRTLKRELSAYAKQMLAAQRALEAKWTKPTMNDRIDAAFAQLEQEGIVALQNAGYTMSDGWEDANERACEMDPRPRGATFYHGQDLERGVKNKGLWLAYGAYVTRGCNEKQSIVLAKDICATLARYGVPTKWNGSIQSRIEIRPFRWQKRQFTKAPRIELAEPKPKPKPKPKKPKPKPKSKRGARR